MTAAPLTADQLLHQLRAARQAGNAAQERQLLQDGLRRYPADPRIANTAGMIALAEQRFADAVSHFATATAADPNEPALWVNLATAYRGQDDDAGEERALTAILDIDRRHFIGQLRLAELLARHGQLSRAVQHWAAVVQLADGMPAPVPPAVTDAKARGLALIAEHNAAFELALADDLDSVGTSDDDYRFRACVDKMMGRRQIFRNECAGIEFPFLPADEFFQRKHFPWFDQLEAKTAAIRAEALALYADANDVIRPYVQLDPGTPQNKWSALDQSLDWSAIFLWEYGVRNDAVCARCPETAAIIDALPRNTIPGKAPSAFFSILRPHSHIPPHTGVTNSRAIIHLPLVVPDGCAFRVGGETRTWREGEAFAFDDTIEHEARNDSDELRIILILDVWNPHLTEREQEQLTRLFAVADRGVVAAGR